MDYSFLVGNTEEFAINFCNEKNLPFALLYTQDKKTIGNDKLVVAVRATVDKIILVVGRFLLNVKEDI